MASTLSTTPAVNVLTYEELLAVNHILVGVISGWNFVRSDIEAAQDVVLSLLSLTECGGVVIIDKRS